MNNLALAQLMKDLQVSCDGLRQTKNEEPDDDDKMEKSLVIGTDCAAAQWLLHPSLAAKYMAWANKNDVPVQFSKNLTIVL